MRHAVLILVLPALAGLAACGGGSPSAPGPAPFPVSSPTPPPGPPNVVVILADDMGYGDLSSFGSPTIKTPNIDRLAAEGARLTDFHVPSALCTPSRAALLTGLYPPRTGLTSNLPSGSPTEGISDGIDDDEITLPEALRERGYRTHMVGKWHLGSTVPHLPTRHGFDSYFGISNGDQTYLLLRDTMPVPDPPPLDQLTKLYTAEAVKIIRESPRDRPFFLYLAHRSPHVPLEPSPEFRGRSARGLYGDVVEEMDWSVGEVLRALRESGRDRNTFVFFFSDNGPWLSQGDDAGSSGPYRSGKNSPFEGGLRVPAVAWWPGRIPSARTVDEPLLSLDLFPTIVSLAGGQLSPARRYYGADLLPLLAGSVPRLPGPGMEGARLLLGYYFGEAVALREGRWKYIKPGYWDPFPAVYDLQADVTETLDLLPTRPDLAATLRAHLDALADEVSRGAKKPKHGGGAGS